MLNVVKFSKKTNSLDFALMVDSADKAERQEYDETKIVEALVKEANRALDLDYRHLTLDYYPSMMNETHQSLYEDDKTTTAYQLGQYRKTYFDAYYLHNQKSFMVHLSQAIGNYHDDIYKRKIILKFNLLKDLPPIKAVKINGSDYPFKIYPANPQLMPLEFGYYSNIADTLVVEFEEFLDQEYWIEFFTK